MSERISGKSVGMCRKSCCNVKVAAAFPAHSHAWLIICAKETQNSYEQLEDKAMVVKRQ